MSSAQLESVVCDLCGSEDAELFLRLKDRMFETTHDSFCLVRCRGCGLLYLNPRPTAAQVGEYYQETYAPFARTGVAGWAKQRTLDRDVAKLWNLMAPPARVVDVGCATGDLLHAIARRGNHDLLGIEPSAHAAQVARDRRHLDVFTGTLEAAKLPADSVDVALIAHTIEHLPSPSDTLDEMRRVLKQNGKLILWLPNADSLAAHLLGEWWIGYDAPRHFHTFTTGTLERMLNSHGFEVESISYEWIGLEWSWALRLMTRDRFHSRQLDALLTRLHPALTLFFTPLSAASALIHKSGRIRVIARKRG